MVVEPTRENELNTDANEAKRKKRAGEGPMCMYLVVQLVGDQLEEGKWGRETENDQMMIQSIAAFVCFDKSGLESMRDKETTQPGERRQKGKSFAPPWRTVAMR